LLLRRLLVLMLGRRHAVVRLLLLLLLLLLRLPVHVGRGRRRVRHLGRRLLLQ
jgi:hypothetical protein